MGGPRRFDVETSDQTHEGPPRCESCGTVVSQDYVRVFGLDNETLHHCWSCKSRTERY